MTECCHFVLFDVNKFVVLMQSAVRGVVQHIHTCSHQCRDFMQLLQMHFTTDPSTRYPPTVYCVAAISV